MGSGGSFDKRDAGQAAARQALQRLGQLPGEAWLHLALHSPPAY
jgi:dsRNA-specific ribonuclease